MFTQWYKGGTAVAVAPPPSGLFMTVGSIDARPGYTPLFGFASQIHYLEGVDGGTISYKNLRDMRDPANPKIVRFAGLVLQQDAYLVISFEELAGVPDPSWPQFTWKLKVNGVTIYDFTGAPLPSVEAPCIGRYIFPTPLPNWNAGTVGQTVTLEFV